MKIFKSVISFILILSMVLSLTVFAEAEILENCIGELFPDTNVRIAFLGGSITEGAGASSADKRWTDIIANELAEKFAENGKTVEALNAGFGGTPSDFGLFRLEKQILDFKPDLVFVDFAVNDIYYTDSNIKQYMENIVQKLNSLEDAPYIVFLYMGTKYKEPPKAETHQAVADYYGIPSINLHTELHGSFLEAKKAEYNNDLQSFWDSPKEGNDTKRNAQLKAKYANVEAWKAAVDATASFDSDGYGYDYWLDLFLVDVYHPSDVGYEYYANVISDKLNNQPRSYFKKAAQKEYSFGRVYENPDSIPVTMAEMSEGWSQGTYTMYSNHPECKVYTTSKAGETLTYYFKGKVFGIIGYINSDGGTMSLTIDGVPQDNIVQGVSGSGLMKRCQGLKTNLSDDWHKAVLTTTNTGTCRVSFFATDFPYSVPDINDIASDGESFGVKSANVYSMPVGISKMMVELDGYPDKGTFTAENIKVYKNNTEIVCEAVATQETKSVEITLPAVTKYGESYKIVLSDNMTYDGIGAESTYYLATASEFLVSGLKVTKPDGSNIYSRADIGTQVAVSLKVTNFLDAKKDISLISGLYGSDGVLKNAWLEPQSIEANTMLKEMAVPVDAGNDGFKDGDYVKIFLWDSLLKPYIKTVLFTVNDAALNTADKDVLAFVLDEDVKNLSLSNVTVKRTADGEITFTGTADKNMNITMKLVNAGGNICYINQTESTEGDFVFNIKPNTLSDGAYTLHLSGN